MKSESNDRRVRKTRLQLRAALVKLLGKKELRDISVSELTELADINRGTFYLHYKDIFDLYGRMENEVLEELLNMVNRHVDKENRRELLPVVLDVLEYCRANADLCLLLLRSGNSVFLTRLLEMVKPNSEREWRGLFGAIDPAKREYCYSFLTAGFIGIIKSWMLAGMKESPEEIASLSAAMIPTHTDL